MSVEAPTPEYPFATCLRRGLALEVRPYRHLRGGGREHAPPVLLEGTFEDDPRWHSFADYRGTVARVLEICGGGDPERYALVGGMDRATWRLDIRAGLALWRT